jgi:hypothetical protein
LFDELLKRLVIQIKRTPFRNLVPLQTKLDNHSKYKSSSASKAGVHINYTQQPITPDGVDVGCLSPSQTYLFANFIGQDPAVETRPNRCSWLICTTPDYTGVISTTWNRQPARSRPQTLHRSNSFFSSTPYKPHWSGQGFMIR